MPEVSFRCSLKEPMIALRYSNCAVKEEDIVGSPWFESCFPSIPSKDEKDKGDRENLDRSLEHKYTALGPGFQIPVIFGPANAR